MKIDIEKIKRERTIKELLEFGIINIDKPSGPTSFDISDFVKNKLQLRKTSHFGTLDPQVTGVLPIALNRGCKLTGFFLGEDKEYVGLMRIHEEMPLKEIEKAIKKNFLGKIKQLPPVKSRVKREEREREVKSFDILEKNDKDVLFKVECQGGTYIRKLVHDLGQQIGVGAHMLELRRIRAGIFKESDSRYPSVNLYDFENAVKEYHKGNEKLLKEIIIPGEAVSELMPTIEIKSSVVKRILTGKPLMKSDLVSKLPDEELFAIFDNNKLIAIMKRAYEKDIVAKPEFVYN